MFAPLLVSGGTLLCGDGTLRKGDLLLEGGRIRKVGARLAARGARVFPARGLLAAPGLIDTQINGGFGISFGDASPGQVLEVGRRLPARGVTSYVPTVTSRPRRETLRAISNLVAASRLPGGAEILGIHLEGPFLSPKYRGAHRRRNLRAPSVPEFIEYAEAARGLLRMVTIAPELPGAPGVIRAGTRRGVVMCAGHSGAAAAEVDRSAIRHVTHVFNAMAPFHHRDEGLLNAALLRDSLSCGMIYDRQHLSAGTARLLLKLKPPGSLVLVSDGSAAMGAPDGEIRADGERFRVKGGRVTVRGTGRLAGSAVFLLDAVRFLVEDAGLPIPQALTLAGGAPAKLLGLHGKKGVLREGADADVVLFDGDLRVKAAFVKGEVFHADHH